MTLRSRRSRPLLTFAAAATACCCLSCGGGTYEESSAIRVEPSRISVDVENTSGETLSKVEVFIVPHGEATVYTITPTSLAAGEKREFPIASFRERDGTPLDLRVARIKSVRVSAVTTQGQTVRAEVPWK
jgi:hypothetical protein